ncbi:hypothetical protein GPJ56_002980 [Histomonas meleagridis]|uniref:uncharacterized protein n=1 Tax=Histomonas meleagridis TaxID=135588 RepID=UPI00355AC543|nr:hypothetical protein GPJ56_002980 [Histomonas meleagridis]KAH0796637.1 hypothetical protein GO595_010530 [Histomonas meleagridis]
MSEEKQQEIMISPDFYKIYMWEFNDDEEEVEIKISFPKTFNSKSIIYQLTPEKNAVNITIKGEIVPLVRSLLFGTISEVNVTRSDTQFTLCLTKEKPGAWELPFTDVHPSFGDADPQTCFILFHFLITKGDQDRAIDFLNKSANFGYLPAIETIIENTKQFLSNEDLPQNDRIQIFSTITNLYDVGVNKYHDPKFALKSGMFLLQNGVESASVLEIFQIACNAGVSEGFTFQGIAVSPLSQYGFEVKDAKLAVKLFSKALDFDKDEPLANHFLAMHLYNGIGVEKDVKRAKALQENAVKKIPTLEPLKTVTIEGEKEEHYEHNEIALKDNSERDNDNVKKESKGTKIGLIIGGAIVAVAAGVSIYNFMRRRNH